MKRALYEWGGLLFATIAITCGTYWCISSISDKASFAMVLGGKLFMFEDGGVIWTDWIDTPSSIDEFDRRQLMTPDPPIDVHFTVLGATYRKLTWGAWDLWMLRVSLLLPTLASALLAIFCFWRYRRLRTGSGEA